jgi:hypothetical protein
LLREEEQVKKIDVASLGVLFVYCRKVKWDFTRCYFSFLAQFRREG